MKKINLWMLLLILSLAVLFFIVLQVYKKKSLPPTAPMLTRMTAPTILEGFESTQRPTRNSGTWTKRGGNIRAERVAFGTSGTVLRIIFDVLEDGGRFKEAGWWCSLSAMDLRSFASLRFRVSLSDPKTRFLIGFKNGEWLEQKIPINGFLNPTLPPGQWQQITIPLSAFHKIDNWFGMDNISITFRTDPSSTSKAEIFLDDFVLVPAPTPALPYVAPAPLPPYPLPAHAESLPKEQLLNLVQEAAFGFFIDEVNPENGLVKDFCRAASKDHLPIASTAGVGFGLSSLCVGASRGWISDAFAKDRILKTLLFYRDRAEQVHGFFYHFLDRETGQRWEESELSSVDTTLLLAGVLTVANYYQGTRLEKIARDIYERVDWPWMLANGKTLSMGWTPEEGFLTARWDGYCELMLIYLLAIGSPTHPIPASSWYQWARLRNEYERETFIACPPLFTHQYSHIWVDFRDKHDEEANYHENSIAATHANQKWCIRHKDKFSTYQEGFWGLTASDGPNGYMAYGAPYGVDDGTVAPTAAIGSIVFTPEESIGMIRLMLAKLKDTVWGRYGFIDAFNLQNKWFSNKYLAIDQGPIVLMIENYRSGLIWKTFMKDRSVQKALKAARFVKD